MNDNETKGAAEPRNDAPAEPAANETPKQDEFDRLASLPDRHEIRIVCAEEEWHASFAMRHEDFGKPGPIAALLATSLKIAIARMSKELSTVLNLAGCETQMKMQVKPEAAK